MSNQIQKNSKVTLGELYEKISPKKTLRAPIKILIRKKNKTDLSSISKNLSAKEIKICEARRVDSQSKHEESFNKIIKKPMFSLKFINAFNPDKARVERSLTVRLKTSNSPKYKSKNNTIAYSAKRKSSKIDIRNPEIIKILTRKIIYNPKKIEVTGKKIFT